ncbi:MAG: anaerobic ribonucleoside-triphosphate reductase activating protein [Lachnospiraceae bacterium]|nr:anaerobic ribonucleoside-triphosphate reductase activating protein [Lachnospiraceae bacterium]
MNICAVKYLDIANGPGCRTCVFVSGCRNRCPGCFQPETWDFSAGEPCTEEYMNRILDSLEPDYVAGITILGGDPMEEENQPGVFEILDRVKNKYPKKNVWIYTGYILDRDLKSGGRKYTEYTDRILKLTDVLVDGPFVLDLKDITLKFRGSSNQRLIDMKKTLETGEIVLTFTDM